MWGNMVAVVGGLVAVLGYERWLAGYTAENAGIGRLPSHIWRNYQHGFGRWVNLGYRCFLGKYVGKLVDLCRWIGFGFVCARPRWVGVKVWCSDVVSIAMAMLCRTSKTTWLVLQHYDHVCVQEAFQKRSTTFRYQDNKLTVRCPVWSRDPAAERVLL